MTGVLRPPEVEGIEEVDLGKQSWESIVPPLDRGSGLFSSSCGARAGGGLDCVLGDVFGGRGAKQRSGPAERKAALPWCVYAPQVPQPKEDLTLQTLNDAGHPCAGPFAMSVKPITFAQV